MTAETKPRRSSRFRIGPGAIVCFGLGVVLEVASNYVPPIGPRGVAGDILTLAAVYLFGGALVSVIVPLLRFVRAARMVVVAVVVVALSQTLTVSEDLAFLDGVLIVGQGGLFHDSVQSLSYFVGVILLVAGFLFSALEAHALHLDLAQRNAELLDEIESRKRAEEALHRRDAILESVAFAAEQFLKAGGWAESIEDVLERLGRTTEVCRLYIFENFTSDTGARHVRRVHEWVAPGIERRERPELYALPYQQAGFGRWEELLSRGEIVQGHVQDFPPEERRVLEEHNVASLVVVPVLAGSDWWGFIGFDDCRGGREWSTAEVDAFKAAAATLGAAIQRTRIEQVVVEQRAAMVAASRLSSLGAMASGVAHEINNPLTAISVAREHLAACLTAPVPDRELVTNCTDTIERNATRIERIVEGLRALSRDGTRAPFAAASVQKIVDDALELCRERFKAHGIVLEVSAIPEDLAIECRAMQLSQVLLNLLNNAYDAVAALEERRVTLAVTDAGETVEFAVTDSGSGLPGRLVETVFEPFFTTKDVGKGTGLGLSISRAIAERHHGALAVDVDSPTTRLVLQVPKTQPTPDTELLRESMEANDGDRTDPS